MFEDPLFWILVSPGLLLGVYAQWRIKINFAKYSRVGTQDGITGADVARRLLNSQGLQKVAVESTPGILKDHYDPRSKTLRLSQEVYFTPSVAAAGIAAHETGHALQDAEHYLPLEARTYIVPAVQLASKIAPWLFVAGVMLQLPTPAWVGIILFGSSSLFAFLTLPVEFNASTRAQELLLSQGIIKGDEQIAGVQKVLGAAAWTYVAAAVSAIGFWLFFIFVLLSQARPAAVRR
jgi:uncharacterized protein